MASILHRMARWVAHHPILALLVWAGLIGCLTGLVTVVGAKTTNDTSLPGTESQDATNVLAADFPPTQNGTSPVVFKVTSGTVNSSANKAAISASVAAIAKVPHVASAPSPYGQRSAFLISKSKTIAYTPVLMDVNAATITERQARAVLAAAEPARKAGVEVAAGGTVGSTLSHSDTDSSTVVGLIAAVIILGVSFGSLVAMFLPIISAIAGVIVGLAVVGLLGHLVSVPSIAPTLAIMIGLGVGIDYALFVVSRHREQLAAGMEPKESVALAVGTAGTAVVFAGGTLVLALLSLGVAGIPLISSLGYGSSLAVVTAVLAALVMLPAILSLLGHRQRAADLPPPYGGGSGRRWRVGPLGSLRGPASMVDGARRVAHPRPHGHSSASHEPGAGGRGRDLTTTQRQAYNLMSEGFGVGFNGPLLVAVTLDPPATEDPKVAQQEAEAKALKAQLEQEQAQGLAEQTRLEAEAASAQAEAARLKSQRQELEREARGLAAQRDQLLAQARALRAQAARKANARAAALRAQASAAAARAETARQKAAALRAAIATGQADIAAVQAQIAATVDPAVLAVLQARKADLEARVGALIQQADIQEAAQAKAKAEAASLRARASAALAAARNPALRPLLVQAEALAAQARTLAREREALIRRRDALIRQEAALAAQVASLERQKQQLEALRPRPSSRRPRRTSSRPRSPRR